MQPHDLLVALVGPRANALSMHVLQPVGEELPDFLLRSGDEYALLLLVQGCLELFLNLLSSLSVEEFALSSFERDLRCPPAVLAPVDGALAASTFCHEGTPFLSCARLSV